MRARLGPFTALPILLVGAVLLTQCRREARPMTPLARDFELVGLDGTHLKASNLRGKPWVVNFWIPG